VNATARHASHFPAETRGVLVVANPSQDPRATARLVAAMHAREPVRIHVAAVQCPPTGYAASYLRAINVNKVLDDLGRQRMASLCAELDALGIAHRTHVEIGRWAEGITRLARDLGCGRVLIGTNPRRALSDAALRFDLWLLRGALRRDGCDCTVMRGDESSFAGTRAVGAVPHLP
jgi:hypothetical protein